MISASVSILKLTLGFKVFLVASKGDGDLELLNLEPKDVSPLYLVLLDRPPLNDIGSIVEPLIWKGSEKNFLIYLKYCTRKAE